MQGAAAGLHDVQRLAVALGGQQQGQGQGAGPAGILDAGGVGIAHVDHGQHVQHARAAAPPDDAAGHFAGHAVLAAQHARGGDAVLGLHVHLTVQQQMADAGQAHQMDALFRVGDGAGQQLQLGAHLPVGRGAAYLEPDGALPAGDLHLIAVLVGQLLAGDALERGLGRGALAEGQQGAEGPCGVDAELTARHAQAAFLHRDETGLFRPQAVRTHGLPGQLRLPGRIQARGREKDRRVAAGAPFGKIECWHNPSFCIYSVCYRRARLSSHRASPADIGAAGSRGTGGALKERTLALCCETR